MKLGHFMSYSKRKNFIEKYFCSEYTFDFFCKCLLKMFFDLKHRCKQMSVYVHISQIFIIDCKTITRPTKKANYFLSSPIVSKVCTVHYNSKSKQGLEFT